MGRLAGAAKDMILRIANEPRDYAWGPVDAISGLLGGTPTGRAEAELWFGTHPESPSRLLGSAEPLATAIGELPYLLKVLSAEVTLSLQVHPDAEQAGEGFARENAAGIPLDAPHRVYRDPRAKSEIILAISDRFEAHVGFRPASEAAARITRLVEAAGPEAPGPAAELLSSLRSDATVGEGFLWLLSDEPDARTLVALLLGAIEREAAEFPIQARIAALHPGDPGVIGTVLLNHVVLARGEALAVYPGTIHAYLRGTGIEILSASDNVVRGGLTPKHVDVGELGRLLTVRAERPATVTPVPLPGGGVEYAPEGDSPPFRLVRVTERARVVLDGTAIALCIAGGFALTGERSAIALVRGEAVAIAPEEAFVEIAGGGELYLAR